MRQVKLSEVKNRFSPDRATGGHGRETGPSCPQILRRYINGKILR